MAHVQLLCLAVLLYWLALEAKAAPPLNIDCDNAVPLSNGVVINGTTMGAPDSSLDCGRSDGLPRMIVWYTYNTTFLSSELMLDITFGPSLAILSGTCENLQCEILHTSSDTLVFDQRALGTQYFIAVITSWMPGRDFSLTLTETEVVAFPPERCSGAVPLTADVPYSNSTINSGKLRSPCLANYYTRDFYLSYTTVGENVRVEISSYDEPSYPYYDLFILNGTDCDSVTQCTSSVLVYNGRFYRTQPLPSGSLILFSVRNTAIGPGTSDRQFTVLVSEEAALPPPANSWCAGALPLVADQIFNGSSIGANEVMSPFLFGTVWFEFTPSYPSALVSVSTCIHPLELLIYLRSDPSCEMVGDYYQRPCFDNQGVSVTFPAEGGVPLYLSMQYWLGERYSILVLEQEIPTVTNDRCESAIPIIAGTPQVVNYFSAAVEDFCTSRVHAVFFTFTSQQSESVISIYLRFSYDLFYPNSRVWVIEQSTPICSFDSCPEPVPCNQMPCAIARANEAAGTTYVVAFGEYPRAWQSAPTDTTLTIVAEERVIEPVLNIDCSAAEDISFATPVSGNLYYARPPAMYYDCSEGLTYRYTVVNDNMLVEMELAHDASYPPVYISLQWRFSTCTDDCNWEEAPVEQSASPGPYNSGDVLFIRVASYVTSAKEFNLTVTEIPATPPANINCADATPLSEGVLVEATLYPTFTVVDDAALLLFYKYTSTTENSSLTVTLCRTNGVFHPQARCSLYHTDCDQILAQSDSMEPCTSLVVANQETGSDFYFAVGRPIEAYFRFFVEDLRYTYKITIEEALPPALSDNGQCDSAQPLFNTTSVSGSTVGLPLSSFGGQELRIAWYTYTKAYDSGFLILTACPTNYQTLRIIHAVGCLSSFGGPAGPDFVDLCVHLVTSPYIEKNTTLIFGVYGTGYANFALEIQEFPSKPHTNYLCQNAIPLSNGIAVWDDNLPPPQPAYGYYVGRCSSSGVFVGKYFSYITQGGASLEIILSSVFGGPFLEVLRGSCLSASCVTLDDPDYSEALYEQRLDADFDYRYSVIGQLPMDTNLIIVATYVNTNAPFQIMVQETSIPLTPSATPSVSSTNPPSLTASETASTTESPSLSADKTPSVSASSSWSTSRSPSSSIITSSSAPDATRTPSFSRTEPSIVRSTVSENTGTMTPTNAEFILPPVPISPTASPSASRRVTPSHRLYFSPQTTEEGETSNTLRMEGNELVRVQIDPSGTNTIVITEENGDRVLSVRIPSSVVAQLPSGSLINAQSVQGRSRSIVGSLTKLTRLAPSGSSAIPAIRAGGFVLGSEIIDLTFTTSGDSPLSFSGEVLLCFPIPTRTHSAEGGCIGFLNELTEEWQCEDEAHTNGAGDYCGVTTHFTSFALLLSGPCENGDCSSGQDYTLSWLSLGFGGGALIIVLFAAVLVEIAHRRRNYVRRKASQRAERMSGLSS